jgi:hypothetical protein
MEFRVGCSDPGLLCGRHPPGHQIEPFFRTSIFAISLRQRDEHVDSRRRLGHPGIRCIPAHVGDSIVNSTRTSHGPAPEKRSCELVERHLALDCDRKLFIRFLSHHPSVANQEMG